jgi:hypothetical protein
MTITALQTGVTFSAQTALAKQAAGAEKTGLANAVSSSASSIVEIKSGRELMLSRLWEISRPDYEPPYLSRFERDGYNGKVYAFLNSDDRNLVSELYEYARDNGIGFEKVDSFAFNLACYREFPDSQSGYLGGAGDKNFTAEFREEDEKIIQRLMTSNAIRDTTIDHAFLEYMFDRPNKTIRSDFSFEFLQEVVFSHSASGSDGSANPDAVVPLRPWQKLEMFRQGFRDQGWNEEKIGLEDFLAQQRGDVASKEEGRFGKYAGRINPFMRSFLTHDDKNLLGLAYAMAEEKGEKLEKIDKLAHHLALFRIQQDMMALLARNVTDKKEEDVRLPDVAHHEILGEMKKMSE